MGKAGTIHRSDSRQHKVKCLARSIWKHCCQTRTCRKLRMTLLGAGEWVNMNE